MEREIAPRIVVDLQVRSGRPAIKGTRVPVDMLVAAGMSLDEVAEEYDVTVEDIRAALSYPAATQSV